MVSYKIIVVTEAAQDYASQIFLQLLEFGIEVEMDIDYNQTLNSRHVKHQNDVIITIGALDVANKHIAVRFPNQNEPVTIKLDDFVNNYVFVDQL
jgi:threonyl-tRNA synthetase